MDSIVTICGMSRSGSTMLDLILGNSPDAFSCGEVYAWFRPHRKHHFKIDCSCGEDPCLVWEKIKNVEEHRFHKFVIQELGVHFVIDSSKDLCWMVDTQTWGEKSNLTVHNLLIWKEPIDLVYSFWKRGQSFSCWKKSFVSYYGKFFQMDIPFRAVKYNAIVEDPSGTTKEICNTIGMPYSLGKEKFWKKEHHCLFGSGGIKQQLERGNSVITGKHEFPESFLTYFNRIHNEIVNDEEVQRIITTLQKHDINERDTSNETEQKYGMKHLYPLWYYGKKIQFKIRRVFPESYDASRFVNVETVPNIRDDRSNAADTKPGSRA